MSHIFHITTDAAWAEALRRGEYLADSLSSEGFIHCSDEQQVAWVANDRFQGRTDLLLLHVDPVQLQATVRYENLEGGKELFPHVYGPIPVVAVMAISPLRLAADGLFTPFLTHRAPGSAPAAPARTARDRAGKS